MIRVVLPVHLRTLAGLPREVTVEVDGVVTPRTVLDALEATYPVLRGTIRDHVTKQRRAFLRFYVGEDDWSLESQDAPLPDVVTGGREPFVVIGAMAGG